MNQSNFKPVGSSVLSPNDMTRRKEVFVKMKDNFPKKFDEQIQFLNGNDVILSDISYTLYLEDGTAIQGVTDQRGMTARVSSDKPIRIVEATLKPEVTQHFCCAQQGGAPETLTIPINNVATNAVAVGTSFVQVATPDGESRPLTAGEISMAQDIFASSIDYSKVKVHKRGYLWFGLQREDIVMTPNGEIYYNKSRFLEDYSQADFASQLTFIHEMVHVWQYQLGYSVKLRGAIRANLDYQYTLDPNKLISDYNMEAQGNLLADYWALKTLGKYKPKIYEIKHRDDFYLYRVVLKNFISDPSDKRNLPGG